MVLEAGGGCGRGLDGSAFDGGRNEQGGVRADRAGSDMRPQSRGRHSTRRAKAKKGCEDGAGLFEYRVLGIQVKGAVGFAVIQLVLVLVAEISDSSGWLL